MPEVEGGNKCRHSTALCYGHGELDCRVCVQSGLRPAPQQSGTFYGLVAFAAIANAGQLLSSSPVTTGTLYSAATSAVDVQRKLAGNVALSGANRRHFESVVEMRKKWEAARQLQAAQMPSAAAAQSGRRAPATVVTYAAQQTDELVRLCAARIFSVTAKANAPPPCLR